MRYDTGLLLYVQRGIVWLAVALQLISRYGKMVTVAGFGKFLEDFLWDFGGKYEKP